MKLVRAERLKSLDDYSIVERPDPVPSNGEVLINVAACSLGYVDALLALGRYQVKPVLPFTPGQEVGGVIEAVGDGVETFKVGDRVMAGAFGGGLAEKLVVPQGSAYRIPANMSFAQASVFRINYITAIHGLIDRANIQEGERLLVFGSAGGVGTAAIQIASLLGAEIIAVASTPEKRAFALENGAHKALDTDPEGWRDRLKAAAGDKGPDVIFDPVCGALFEMAFRSLVWRGRHLVVGFAGGPFPSLPINLPLLKGAALIGVDARPFPELESERFQDHMSRLFRWVEEGSLVPTVGRCFPLSKYSEALTFALSGRGLGKTVVEIAD